MSLSLASGDRPVHLPADPNKFQFDKEVSAIFPDMALRAIPNFYESHKAHARMLAPLFRARGDSRILDIGASRGAFFNALIEEYGGEYAANHMQFTAMDNSPEMCEYLRKDFPLARVLEMDITGPDFMNYFQQYDVVCVHYVLQFVPKDKQERVLRKVFSLVRPGGVLIYGHKSAHYGPLGASAHEEYIRFRMNNGYTREEIEAKTKALQGSMHCMNHDDLLDVVDKHFATIQETFRFMMFSTFMAVK